MRFVVAQLGARRNYAVPVILEEAGMLERFYTDAVGNVGLGRWLLKWGRLLGWTQTAARLASRKIPEIIRSKTVTLLPGRLLRQGSSRICRAGPVARFREQLRFSREFGLAAIRRGFGAATHIYTMLGESGPMIGEAKARGLTVATEFYILLSAERIVAEEQKRFADWELPPIEFERVRSEFPEQRTLLSCVDYAVCPSQTVRCDLEENFGFRENRSAVVPYGVDPRWLKLALEPTIGRVLFVGTANLRKGIQYVAGAAELLRNRGRQYDFRIAGDVSECIAGMRECRNLIFLGRVPRFSIQREFSGADVFVMPSLAEGSAEATYEALAAGLPVITTAASGSVVRQGVEGWIVAERDIGGLAAAIERVVQDRQLRAEISKAARLRAGEYTLDRYGQRLVAALRGFGA